MTPIDYGSAKSSGSVSESSASSDSASSDSGSGTSTSGSGDVFDSSGSGSDSTSGTSDTSTGGSSGSSNGSGSTGDYCSWAIESITYSADNEMMFVLHNTGTIPIEFTAIWVASDPSMIDTTIAPDVSPSTPSASFTVAAGGSQNVAVVSNGDLRNVEFYVDSSCGFKFDTFPNA